MINVIKIEDKQFVYDNSVYLYYDINVYYFMYVLIYTPFKSSIKCHIYTIYHIDIYTHRYLYHHNITGI